MPPADLPIGHAPTVRTGPGSAALHARNRRMLVVLALISCAMLGVGFAMIPLYRIFCKAAGATPNPNTQSVATAAGVHTGRFLEVYFEGWVKDGLEVRFLPQEQYQRVEVGMEAHNVYHVRNLSDQPVRFRPIHQISPTSVGPHFGMRVCFCFNDQTLGPGESRDLPVRYTFAPELDPRTRDVTIGYTLFAVREDEAPDAEQLRIRAMLQGKGFIVTPGFRSDQPAPAETPAATNVPAPAPGAR